jgi:osmotically-inducible protein OsmY
MLGPITTQRVDCSVKTYKDGSNPVLVRLDDNTIFSVNKEKMVKDYVGGFGEASGDIKVKSGTMKLKAFTPIERSQIPEGPATKLLDVRTYQAKGSAQLHEKVRHELAMIAYITTFDFISFTLVGNDVILTGWTVRDTNRSDAEYRVKKIEGVGKVTNNIEILPLGGIDMEIRAAARTALQRTHSTYFWSNGSDIKIVVKNGTIILLGAVRTQQDFDTATIQLNSLSGVFHVFNMLRVTPPAPKDKG